MNRLSIMGAPIALLLINFPTHPVAAQHRHHYRHTSQHHVAFRRLSDCTFTNDGRQTCDSTYRRGRAVVLDANGNRVRRLDEGTIFGGRPVGCPHSYCGCGLRKFLGLSDKRLNLAYNWARLFPHEVAPRPGLAAVRNHHVMYIEAAASDGQWLVRDYNSGGGLSRLHIRDVNGYVFVNPHALIAKR
jgi:hypothetical protein